MTDYILRIYDYLQRHTALLVSSFCITTVMLVALVCRIDFHEDISAFLPLDKQYKESLQVYQDVSGASQLLAIFQAEDTTVTDADHLVLAMNYFGQTLAQTDTSAIIRDMTAQVDYDRIAAMADFVYQNIPLFLTEKHYARIDSLLSQPDYVSGQLAEDLSLLMFPTSGLLASNMENDPLNLFSPAVTELLKSDGADRFELYDGYIFTPDLHQGIIVITSPYGNSETQHNTQLMQLLTTVADSVMAHHPQVSVHYTGGPAIAVGNSQQIRQDSILSVTLATVLILALLYYAFRSLRNILLMVLSILWGWLFALGLLSLFHEGISLIVVGISSIIVGIAVNYPLHLIAHTSHTHDVRQALREITSPLVIGNITTVGAFCALIPLQATALRDLGIFSALLLVGTILFVVLWLPHIIKVNLHEQEHKTPLLDCIATLSFEKHRWAVALLIVLTLIFGWFSFDTRFDADMNHINYMNTQQRADMEYLQQMTSGTDHSQQNIYVVSKGRSIDEALTRSRQLQDTLAGTSLHLSSCPISSKAEQARRIERWDHFTHRYARLLQEELPRQAAIAGFSPDAFQPFRQIICRPYHPQDYAYFLPLQPLCASHVSTDSLPGHYRIIDIVIAQRADADSVRTAITAILPDGSFCFDIESLNHALASNLTDNFNYVGWACALIVFLFLWFSFRNIKLALLTFLPMTVSWIWILGIMALLGIQFNLVNVILGTFIFGQGDDYTIFMTEGCLYERRHGRQMLTSHKRSIALSALIMFIGIGSLIFARHPALHSLAEVTIVGMFSVVLMAYIIPPLFLKTPWPPLGGNEGGPKKNVVITI